MKAHLRVALTAFGSSSRAELSPVEPARADLLRLLGADVRAPLLEHGSRMRYYARWRSASSTRVRLATFVAFFVDGVMFPPCSNEDFLFYSFAPASFTCEGGAGSRRISKHIRAQREHCRITARAPEEAFVCTNLRGPLGPWRGNDNKASLGYVLIRFLPTKTKTKLEDINSGPAWFRNLYGSRFDLGQKSVRRVFDIIRSSW